MLPYEEASLACVSMLLSIGFGLCIAWRSVISSELSSKLRFVELDKYRPSLTLHAGLTIKGLVRAARPTRGV